MFLEVCLGLQLACRTSCAACRPRCTRAAPACPLALPPRAQPNHPAQHPCAQLPAVMLACARIGAVFSVVFAGFSAESLAGRISDSSPKMVRFPLK